MRDHDARFRRRCGQVPFHEPVAMSSTIWNCDEYVGLPSLSRPIAGNTNQLICKPLQARPKPITCRHEIDCRIYESTAHSQELFSHLASNVGGLNRSTHHHRYHRIAPWPRDRARTGARGAAACWWSTGPCLKAARCRDVCRLSRLAIIRSPSGVVGDTLGQIAHGQVPGGGWCALLPRGA